MFNCLLKYPLKRGVSVNTRSRTGEIHKISPVLLCLGSDWEVILPLFYPKTDGFVCKLQFVFNFVNFLQDMLLRIGCIASVHSRSLNVSIELVSHPFHNKFGITPAFFCPCYKAIAQFVDMSFGKYPFECVAYGIAVSRFFPPCFKIFIF